ncbi:uncharacterized protein N7515_009638 [Penicillium bovifimosum]|uniref:Uncharacterized protein n=1 Tax=Penicillium bovifimosum TaxID=126998 RepID=A0A9W9GKY7_9EURO|nr:uncharacterized protein N7515_009638 [Penicillium bovifimosum]KAJ5121677.1 hypothetical protein N7515_009638 [Penicillium bovifimosum]
MVAWIMTDTNPRQCPLDRRRLTDAGEIYLTLAEYKQAYIEYLQATDGGDREPTSFLKMQEYGPWCIDKAQDMSLVDVSWPLLLVGFVMLQLRSISTNSHSN